MRVEARGLAGRVTRPAPPLQGAFAGISVEGCAFSVRDAGAWLVSGGYRCYRLSPR